MRRVKAVARTFPSAPPVDRKLALAALVDEVGRERADRRGTALAVGVGETPLVGIAAPADRAHEVPDEESAEVPPVEAAPEGQQHTECETAQQQKSDELDGGLPALASHRPLKSGQSRTRSTGLMQSFAIRSSSERGIV